MRVTPIFRAYDLDAYRAAATDVGAGLRQLIAFGPTRILYVTDPGHNLLGFQERGGVDDEPRERVLRKRWEADHNGDPGIQNLGWVVLRVADLPRAIDFYQMLGFAMIDRAERFARLDAGNDTILNLSPLGPDAVPNQPITDRNAATRCPIFRVYGFETFLERARNAGAGLMQRVDPEGGHILYLTDPEGNLFAFQERTEDSDRPIDHAMRERWAAAATDPTPGR